MSQQIRIDDAIYAIDACLIELRECINIHRIKTQDHGLLPLTTLINMVRESGSLQTKIHGLLAIYAMGHVMEATNKNKETARFLRTKTYRIAELIEEQIIKV